MRLALIAGAAVLLGASPALASAPVSGLDAYVRARAADAGGATQAALADYRQALAAAPGNPSVALAAYRAALVAGDDRLTAQAAATLANGAGAPADLPLHDLAAAIRGGDAAATDHAIAALGAGPFAFLVPSLRAWVAFDHGARSYPMLATAGAAPLAARADRETAALLQIAGGDADRGAAAVAMVLAAEPSRVDLRLAAARLLVHAGRADLASTLLSGAAAPTAAAPSLAFGARVLLDGIAADLAQGKTTPLSVAVGRAALLIDPSDARARLMLGDALGDLGAVDPALAVLAAVPAGPFADQASAARLTILQANGRGAEALAEAAGRAGRPDADPRDRIAYGDLLVAQDRPADAAPVYLRALTDPALKDSWALNLKAAAAYDAAGDWAHARPLIDRAARLAPGEATPLNFLGYGEIEHGGDIAAATRMLERAHALAPQDAAIADSLGWAYYRGGDLARALPILESAAAASPADAAVNDHLGDALWRAGRRYEARYAWRRALAVADGSDSARIAAKLGAGPPAR